jgi:cytochrome c biogenesis protein CcmG, thiol:disulfide interchange protein DsbE
MKSPSETILRCGVLALFLFSFVTLKPARAEEKPAAKQIWAKSYLNQKAPPLVIEKWLTAAPNYKGKFLLIDFWATWCGPCRKTIPELNRFHGKFGDELVIIGISREEESVVRKMREPRIDYFLAIDRAARLQEKMQVKGIPHCILVDPSGIVRWEGLPTLPGHELTEAVIQEILNKYK